jgi:hypothetical protein
MCDKSNSSLLAQLRLLSISSFNDPNNNNDCYVLLTYYLIINNNSHHKLKYLQITNKDKKNNILEYNIIENNNPNLVISISGDNLLDSCKSYIDCSSHSYIIYSIKIKDTQSSNLHVKITGVINHKEIHPIIVSDKQIDF